MFDIEDYDYNLPEELIAQVPSSDRDAARLMVVERSRRSLTDRFFFDLPDLLRPGDLLVVNNTRVMPAKLIGKKESGGRVELLVLENREIPESGQTTRWCLVRSSKRPKKGSRMFFENELTGVVEALGNDGLAQILFQGPEPLDVAIKTSGLMPLPPYIKRKNGDLRTELDRERYQTVYSKKNGAVAAPTAGLHFTKNLMERLRGAKIATTELTLHVGHGTFRPVRTKDIRNHVLGEEAYIVDEQTASAVNKAKKEGRRVIAVGTTVVRVLETIVNSYGELTAGQGRTGLLITPGFPFRVVDAMITNFHLPKSSLLFLVCAFAGRDTIRKAYGRAVEKRYRFYSYGDAMLIG
ncbi:MAG: tRNA preQ1(34) S-adenosylmethionine ribosyltransferase-isomerase QueA [Deltaproteobacteria bacterium]|nr:tRNA preQ1(34) S-adenosylmethionine ribosyltransferase-isomerase QueA [Deltaproteobacteria bacterium]